MDYDECKKIIVFECIAGDGFLTKLRGHEYSKIQFEGLFKALLFYRESTRNTEMLEKEIICSLYFLDLELSAALKSFSNDDVFRDLLSSQTKCSQLVIEIITPEKMKGPIPEDFL